METLTTLRWGIDALLGLGLLWVAWQSLSCPDLFRAIVLFVAFGLLMALTWARLGAPDVALAEAAIGAGLTGVLLMSAFARSGEDTTQADIARQAATEVLPPPLPGWTPLAALALTAAGLAYAVASLPGGAPGLSAAVAAHLPASGVSHPVTAVLLNFRSYDTLLEMTVLLTALLGVRALGGMDVHAGGVPPSVLDTLARLLVPLCILIAAYLLWAGAHAPGGAFQAGSVLGAAGALMLLAGWTLRPAFPRWAVRCALVSGPGAFVAVAMTAVWGDGQLLEYPPQHAGTVILLLEATATLSIGATLTALFLGRDEAEPR